MRTVIGTCLIAVLWSTASFAQGRDVGLLGGWTRGSAAGSALQFNFGTVYEASYAHRIVARDRVDVAIEIPFLAANSLTIKTPGGSLPREYASLSLTPGVRLMFTPRAMVSAFGAVGGGFANYDESVLRADGSPNPDHQSNTTGAFSFGGGLDVRTGSWLGLRGELRDVVSGARRFSIPTTVDRAHHLVITIGVAIRL